MNVLKTLFLTLLLCIAVIFNHNASFKSSSVLKEGDWYKIGVESTGVYKIDRSFLERLGLNVSNIDPNKVAIYGQRGGMLPQMAGAERIDDLEEIPIKIMASSTNFGSSDYILFYAEGPDKWTYNPNTDVFSHEKHRYDTYKGYFLTIKDENSQTISTIFSSSKTPDLTITKFDDYDFIEEELINLGQTGDLWLGDEFDFITERTYNFNFSNVLTSEPAYITTKLVAFSPNGNASFNVTHNNSTVNSVGILRTTSTSGILDYGRKSVDRFSINPTNSNSIKLAFNRTDNIRKGWLDYLRIQVRRGLRFEGITQSFRLGLSQNETVCRYEIQNVTNDVEIWDVTDQFATTAINYNLIGSKAEFTIENEGVLKEFVMFNSVNNIPLAIGKINNQNLHALSVPDMLIVTREAAMAPANELADLHREKDALSVEVVVLSEIFNEFSSGNQDVTAIRDFVKMLYERGQVEGNDLKYLLLFGDGNYNPRELDDFYLPTFQGDSSLKATYSYVTDDYFGLLDSLDGKEVDVTNGIDLDIGIGRIPADDLQKAQIAVDKIKTYYSAQSFGDWRNHITFIADDEDNNIHINDADDVFAPIAENNYRNYNLDKLYLDAYEQVTIPGGERYPEVSDALSKIIFKGTFFVNYVGHGGANGLTQERVITIDEIEKWNNPDKLPLFITATCEFTRYDDPEVYSAGERAFFKEDGGAIALVTTVRLVFSNRNEIMNRRFLENLFAASQNGALRLGDIVKSSKNQANTGTGNRKFALIGDPALKLAFPQYKVVTTEFKNDSNGLKNDTLKALSKATISGEVRDLSNTLLSDFNGTLNVKVYDKPRKIKTLVNDPNDPPSFNTGSLEKEFFIQKSLIYAGQAEVKQGKFSVEFIAPKDINFSLGEGKISYYAENGSIDAAGNDTIFVGQSVDTLANDNEGPIVEVYIGDENFVSGGLASSSPNLFIKLYDDNGINISGSSIGHDITAILNGDDSNPYILNDFYISDIGDFRSGTIIYPLESLPSGTYDISVKAWDVYNNSGVGSTEFIIADEEAFVLSRVLNYPNPFRNNTTFSFEHNRADQDLDVQIQVFTYDGRLVKTIQTTVFSDGFRVDGIEWNGLGDGGYTIGKGIYVYKLNVVDELGSEAQELKKLVILK